MSQPQQEQQTPPPQQKATPAKSIPNGLKFVFGGGAGMGATMIVQPFDLVKTRMQISGAGSGKKEFRNSFHCMQTVISKEGPLGLYQGIGAALLRQATYTTGRLGMFSYLNDAYKAYFNKDPNVSASMLMGIIAGACGAFIGTPAEVALVRMASDGRLPLAERRNYKNVFNALTRITTEEGLATLWRGSLPTVGRAMVVNMTQLASYSQFKTYFKNGPLQMEEGIKLHFCASMLSGLLTTIASMPLDMAKTRIQNQKYVDGKPEYRGTIDVLGRVLRQEGVLALWKGFTPYYCRLGPHTVLTFIFLEQLNQAYFNFAAKKDL
ncbi:mitochondrial 2-oxoglutarate/malate carrier protein [Musca domestica]|uniref:Mitochondrial 2-oxoglutarate/malate carrier protein n=1 Tax=Musca domestica TaxID=7370 RepID=T1PED8_MUSDO|nr:mitochondrial 2-oxoglutarate/malate carrier protein [Musca domestica]XP_005188746.1 mitochondrial 2-oxoglutarate/malate carrier protein [Musca domestica]